MNSDSDNTLESMFGDIIVNKWSSTVYFDRNTKNPFLSTF